MITQTWPAFEPHNRAVPVYLTEARFRQMFFRVTNIDGLGAICAAEIKTVRQDATRLVTAAADAYAKRYGGGWIFSSIAPAGALTDPRIVAVGHRKGADILVSDVNIDDHIFLSDEAEGSYQFWRAVVRSSSGTPCGHVGECFLSLMFLDRILGEIVVKESVLFRLLEANFWADHFRVESGHDVRDRLGFAMNCLSHGPALALVEEFESSKCQHPAHPRNTN